MPQLGWRQPEVGPPQTRPCPLRPTPPCPQGPGPAGFRPSITGPHPRLPLRPHRPLRPQVGQGVTLRDLWPPDQHVGGKPLSQHSLLHLTEGRQTIIYFLLSDAFSPIARRVLNDTWTTNDDKAYKQFNAWVDLRFCKSLMMIIQTVKRDVMLIHGWVVWW